MSPLAPWLGALAVLAAPPQPAAETKPVYTRSLAFRLPVRLDERIRAGLREIQLHVRRTPDGWQLFEAVAVDRTVFEYRAAQDGEYWFRFVLIDCTGRDTAARADGAPAVVVVVDTQPPEVDVHPVPVASGQVYLQCNVRDAHPDYATVRLEYQLADRSWRPLVPVPNSPGLFLLPDERLLAGRVRATAADKAGNAVSREIDLGQNPE